MSSINGLGGTFPVQQPTGITNSDKSATTDAPGASAMDRLELSGVSHLLKTLKSNGDVRTEKVAAIKAEIEAGTYDADGTKLAGALDGLLDDLDK